MQFGRFLAKYQATNGGENEWKISLTLLFAAGSFKTLVAAVQAAAISLKLSKGDTGAFTVFAPDDDAFASFPREH